MSNMQDGLERAALVEMAKIILEELHASASSGGGGLDFGYSKDSARREHFGDEVFYSRDGGFAYGEAGRRASYAGFDDDVVGSKARNGGFSDSVVGLREREVGLDGGVVGRDVRFGDDVVERYAREVGFTDGVVGRDARDGGFGDDVVGLQVRDSGFYEAYPRLRRREFPERGLERRGRGGNFGAALVSEEAGAGVEGAPHEAEGFGLGRLPEMLSDLFCRDSRRYDGAFERF